ncbi:hypothetical protein M433DRAFT_148882, partial [Acidomyces richmondensis BFW]
QNEGSIMLAMSAFNSGQCDSISAAVKAYNVSKSTLFRRIYRRSLIERFTLTNKKLSKTEEEIQSVKQEEGKELGSSGYRGSLRGHQL